MSDGVGVWRQEHDPVAELVSRLMVLVLDEPDAEVRWKALTALEQKRLNQARQLTVSQLYGDGHSMQQIAGRLGISKSRVQQLLDGHHLARYGRLLALYLTAAELADSAASFGAGDESVLVHHQLFARSVLSSRIEPDHHRAAQRWLGRARSSRMWSGADLLERSILDLRTVVLQDGRLVAADFDRQQRLRILGGYHYGREGRPRFPVASLQDAVTMLELPSDVSVQPAGPGADRSDLR